MPATSFIGEPLQFTVAFDNASPNETGYGPYVDLRLPTVGTDGVFPGSTPATAYDGISFVSATYLGVPVNSTVLTFDAAGQVTHPYTGQTLTGTPGDQFVVLELPFGSFTPTQPAAAITVTTNLDNKADLNNPLTIQAVAGFRYGNDPLDNPATDPPLQQAGPTTGSVQPQLIRLTKTYIGPEDETATGPNFPRQYVLTVDVADGQTVTNLDITDLLPNNLQFVQVDSTQINGSGVATTAISTPTGIPGGTLTRRFASVTGTAGANDASLTFTFFIPQLDSTNAPVIAPSTGQPVPSFDQANSTAEWVPIDTRDPQMLRATSNPVTSNTATHTLTDRSLAIQKSVAIVNDVGAVGASPGDTLEYTLQFQVSDFFAFQNLLVSDVFSDGQRLEASFIPTLQFNGNPWTSPLAGFLAANWTVTPHFSTPADGNPSDGTDGSTAVDFRVSAELVSRLGAGVVGPNGRVLGGLVNPSTGAIGSITAFPPLTGQGDGPTTGVIRFRTVIQEEFSDRFPLGDNDVTQGLNLSNDVQITGDLLQNTAGFPAYPATTVTDTSAAGIEIIRSALTKTIYAINGVTPGPNPTAAPGDTITYRITYTLRTSDVSSLTLADYLPLPVLNAAEVTTFENTPIAGNPAPAAGVARVLTTDTMHTRFPGITPTVSSDTTSGNNTVFFNYGRISDPLSQATTIDILFTTTVGGQAFADGLYLTNQVRSIEDNQISEQNLDSLVQFQLTEPELNVRKGVAVTDNAAGTPSPIPTPSGVTFDAPGTGTGAAVNFSGLLNSDKLTLVPLDSNLSGIDAGDLVKFVIVVENTGSSRKGAFDVLMRDTLPVGFVVPASGLNLKITDGTGATITYTALPGGPAGLELFANGLRLDDPGATSAASDGTAGGAIDGYDATSGRNLAVITYDLQLESSVAARQTLTNTAILEEYANSEGGPLYLSGTQNLTDPASVTVASPQMTKTLVGTEVVSNGNGLYDAVIGERATYRVTITVPEGTTPSAVLLDTLDPGLAFVSIDGITTSPGVSTSVGGGFAAVLAAAQAALASPGATATFNFGDLVNADTNNAAAETIQIDYTVVTLNVVGNQAGTTLNNTVGMTWTGGSVSNVRAAQNVTVVEPQLSLTTSVTVNGGASGDAGDPVVYTITLSNSGSIDAFDVLLNDLLPRQGGGVSLIDNPTITGVTDTGGVLTTANFQLTGSNGTGWTLSNNPSGSGAIDLAGSSLRTITLTIAGTLAAAVAPGQTVTNTPTAQFTSRDGTPGQFSTFNTSSVERTGVDGVGGALNDYAVQASAAFTVTNPGLSKSIVATSESHTTFDAVNNRERVAIGEIVRYRLVSTIPEGTSTNFQLRDNLPPGLTFLNDNTVRVAFVSDGAGISSSTLSGGGLAVSGSSAAGVTPTFGLPVGSITPGSFSTGTDPIFSLGNLVNSDSDANSEYVVLEFNAIVDNTSNNTTPTNRDNTFSVLVNGSTLVTSTNLVRTRNVTPSIANPVKTVQTAGPFDAGDVVAYRITYSNATGADRTTAFDVRLLDTMPTGETLNLGSIVVTTAGGASGVTNASAGNTLDITLASIPAGGSVQIDYTVTLASSLTPNQTITNIANLTYTSLPGTGTASNPTGSVAGTAGSTTGERTGSGVGVNTYLGSGSAPLVTTAPPLTKTVTATSLAQTSSSQFNATNPDLAIGETATFQMTFTLTEGTTTATLTDNLPTVGGRVMSVVSSRVVSIGSSISGSLLAVGASGTASDVNLADGFNDRVVFNFGSLLNTPDNIVDAGDQIVVEVVARLEDVVANVAGQLLTNSAILNYGTGTASATASVDVVEPQLVILKTSDRTSGDARDVVTYTVTVSHAGGSSAPAFDQVISDLLMANLLLIPGTVTTSVGSVLTGNGIGDTTVQVSVPSLLLTDPAVTVTYQARIADAALPGATLTNTATLNYDGLPGPGGRTGSGDSSRNVTVNSSQVSGFVYSDANNDGIKGGSEAAIGGVTVTLTGTDHLGASVSLTATTLADGSYSFINLRPGSYAITETQPATWLDGLDTPGTLGTTAAGNDTFTRNIPAGSNLNSVNNNFGELAPASVAGFVYSDLNNDGVKQGGELGISGVTVTLTGTDDLGPVSLTTTTDGTGAYSFTNLRPGTYTVTETQPVGYLDGRDTIGTPGGTTANDVFSAINLNAGVNGVNNNFGELLPSSLSGFVFADSNNDGFKGGSEAGIGGVTVTLTGTDDLGNAVNVSTTTDGTGAYSFPNLRPGTYVLTETQPASYVDGRDTIGSQLGTTSNDAFSAIVLGAGVNGVNNNFGELLPASLSGFVYADLNNNGVKEGSESGIVGATVTLTGTDDRGNTVTRTTTTDGIGVYSFTDLRPGNYTILETQPAGYLDGWDTIGTPGGTQGNDGFTNIVLGIGVNGTNNNFGELPPASLAGFVYADNNNDGIKGGSEAGIGNVTVTLTGTDDRGAAVSRTATTDGTGAYSFTNLRPGTYRLAETQPAGYFDGRDTIGTPGGATANDVFSAIVLSGGVSGVNNNFGELPPSSLSGHVYVDVNNDGVKQGTEAGIGNITVTLTGTNDLGQPVSLTTTTSATGYYRFANLRPGTYRIRETQPAGNADGRDTIGSQLGTTSNDEFLVALLGGVDGIDNNFGELVQTPQSLSGRATLRRCGVFLNRTTGMRQETIQVTNTGPANLLGQIQLVLTGLTPGVTVANATGYTAGGLPYVTLNPPNGRLARGQTFSVVLQYSTSSNGAINFTLNGSTGSASML